MEARSILTVAGVIFYCLMTDPALAQTNWLEMGKGALKDQLGGSSSSSVSSGGGRAALSGTDIAAGLIEALKVGTERVVGKLGKADGFNADPEIHIPLPDNLKSAQSALKMVGASGLADDLELKLNRAAEAATPKAKEIFFDALKQMSFDDARNILNGPKDAATQYFKRTMTPPLVTAMHPVVDTSLSEAGAIKAYDALVGRAKGLPLVPDLKADLIDHVLKLGLAGLFTNLAREEAAIRENPAQRSTDILKKVFGQ
jgi:hypothetical protein